MHALPRSVRLGRLGAFALLPGLLAAGCADKGEPDMPATAPESAAVPGAQRGAAPSADAPDTRDIGPLILDKINANPSVGGTATLVEFRQKSIATQPLGDKMRSAVVEFEGVVTFSKDVSWSWQGPTRAGAPQRFEARAEFVDQGQGWQRVEPLGIYPL
jgi:hypothetical protein